MEIRITGKDKEEIQLMESFCNTLIKNMAHDIRSNINFQRLQVYEKKILNAKWIKWNSNKPKSINMLGLLESILDSIEYQRRNNTGEYAILFNSNMRLYGSRTSINRIARFIDKGNESIPGIYVFSNTFNKYSKNIDQYWKAYIASKLNRLYVTRLVTLK